MAVVQNYKSNRYYSHCESSYNLGYANKEYYKHVEMSRGQASVQLDSKILKPYSFQYMNVCVHVCVWERDRFVYEEGDREKGRENFTFIRVFRFGTL